MTLKRLFEGSVAHASYLVGSNRQAVIIDPNRDTELYLREAAGSGMRIVAVAETHIHADYASGAYELAKRTGATLYVSNEGPPEWKYAFAGEANVVAVRDGDTFSVGGIEFEVVATPGHTPEHVTYVASGSYAFTGDFMFVGDVGRPDLLERAAGIAGTMEASARALFGSLGRFAKRFDDSLLICPAHGAGSACGKSLGNVPFSSLGIERRTNWALRVADEGEFVRQILEGQPEPPSYFKEMKRINKERPDFTSRQLCRMTGSQLVDRLMEGAPVVDLRSSGEVASGGMRGAIAIPFGPTLPTWAGWTLPYDQDVYFLTSNAQHAEQAADLLSLIGITRVAGWSGTEALRAYEAKFGTLLVTPQFDPRVAAEAGAQFLDVRAKSEFDEGHIMGSEQAFVGALASRPLGLPLDAPLLVYCGGGERSMLAASLLQRDGYSRVSMMPGGFADWEALGLPVESGVAVLI